MNILDIYTQLNSNFQEITNNDVHYSSLFFYALITPKLFLTPHIFVVNDNLLEMYFVNNNIIVPLFISDLTKKLNKVLFDILPLGKTGDFKFKYNNKDYAYNINEPHYIITDDYVKMDFGYTLDTYLLERLKIRFDIYKHLYPKTNDVMKIIYELCLCYHGLLKMDNNQLGIPPEIYSRLKKEGYLIELFGSPFNATLNHFCSIFPYNDKHFGSIGSYFEIDFNNPFKGTVFEKIYKNGEELKPSTIKTNNKYYKVIGKPSTWKYGNVLKVTLNPPYVTPVMDETYIRITEFGKIFKPNKIMTSYEIYSVHPVWDNDDREALNKKSKSKFKLKLQKYIKKYYENGKYKEVDISEYKPIKILDAAAKKKYIKNYIKKIYNQYEYPYKNHMAKPLHNKNFYDKLTGESLIPAAPTYVNEFTIE